MDVMQAIVNRRSVRKYAAKAITKKALQKLRDALRLAPSACNFQPWRFIFVQDADLRENIARAANGQLWMAEAPLTVVACGVPEDAYKRIGGTDNSAAIDVAIALDHLTLVAVSEKLGTCWIGAFDETLVKRLLNIPPRVRVIAMTPVGYPASPDLIHPPEAGRRKSEQDVFSIDQYDNGNGNTE